MNTNFDPNNIGVPNGNYFGFPYTNEEANVIIYPVSWDVTTSYSAGTAKGPKAIKEASLQLDFFDFSIPNAHLIGIGTYKADKEVKKENKRLRKFAEHVIIELEEGVDQNSEDLAPYIAEVNAGCDTMVRHVKAETGALLAEGKLITLLGGDHSTPLGYLQALAEHHAEFGILQIDAHADLREAYEGFTYSHASIMYNALQIESVKKLVQVGIRDLCEAENNLAESHEAVKMFNDFELKNNAFNGLTWQKQCDAIIAELPQKVYISFDIDGLDPSLCPNTGTPVAGGLSFNQALYLIEKVVESGRTIIGCDLVEVAPGYDEWDANVGARMLYKMSNWMYISNNRDFLKQ